MPLTRCAFETIGVVGKRGVCREDRGGRLQIAIVGQEWNRAAGAIAAEQIDHGGVFSLDDHAQRIGGALHLYVGISPMFEQEADNIAVAVACSGVEGVAT